MAAGPLGHKTHNVLCHLPYGARLEMASSLCSLALGWHNLNTEVLEGEFMWPGAGEEMLKCALGAPSSHLVFKASPLWRRGPCAS